MVLLLALQGEFFQDQILVPYQRILIHIITASLYVMWLQRRRVLKDLYPLHSPNEISISLCIRLGIFTIYSMLGLA